MKCRFCGIDHENEAPLCPTCGMPMDAPDLEPEPDADEAQVKDTIKCVACSEEYPTDTEFCQYCGSPLRQQAPEHEPNAANSAPATDTIPCSDNAENNSMDTEGGPPRGSLLDKPVVEDEPSATDYAPVIETRICSSCGYENAVGADVCSDCGTELAATMGSSQIADDWIQPTTNRIPQKIIGIAVACIALIMAGLILFPRIQSEAYQYPQASINFFFSPDNQSSVVVNANVLESKIEGSVALFQTSLDGAKAVALSSKQALYFITPSELIKIADDVGPFALSSSGNAVAYMDTANRLSLYSYQDKKSLTIANNLTQPSLAISPDGKTVSYTGSANGEDELFIYSDGKSTSAGAGLRSVAVANGGKYLYAYDPESTTLYVSSLGKEQTELATGIANIFVLNRDHTQIIFYSDQASYISSNGKDKQKISDHSFTLPYFPEKAAIVMNRNIYSGEIVISYSLSSLLNKIFATNENELVFIDKKYVSNPITTSVLPPLLTALCDVVFYTDDEDNLYQTSVSVPDKSTPLAEDVQSFTISSDGKYVYYVNSEDELWFKPRNAEAKKIADEVYYASLAITKTNTLFFIADDMVLYACSNGQEKNKVADHVYAVQTNANAAYYYANYDSMKYSYDLYGSPGNTDFTLMMEEVYPY